ncbi:MAG: DMT family transporter [Planctomycetes bacterium]|nr:DMT family transporter [Planctomycetota bacterium]
MPDPTTLQGEYAALATAFCWTITALTFESASRRVGSLAVNLIRLVIALVFLSAYCWFSRGLLMPIDATGRAWSYLALSGLVGFTIGDLCLFRAFVLIGARVSLLIQALVPPFTALLGWMALNEEMAGVELLGMLLTMSGVLLVVSEKRNDENGVRRRLPAAGVLLAVAAALGQAGGLVLSKIGMGDYDAFAATQIRIVAGSLGFALLFTFIRWWPRVLAACRDAPAMRRMSLGAFFGPFLGVSLSLLAVQHTKVGVGATIMAITPILIIPPSIVIFREKVTPRAILGTVIAVLGVAVLFGLPLA